MNIAILILVISLSVQKCDMYKRRGVLVNANQTYYFFPTNDIVSINNFDSVINSGSTQFEMLKYILEQSKISERKAAMRILGNEYYACGDKFSDKNMLRYAPVEITFRRKKFGEEQMEVFKTPKKLCLFDFKKRKEISVNYTQNVDEFVRFKILLEK